MKTQDLRPKTQDLRLKMLYIFYLASCILYLVSGCGYHLVGSGSSLPGHIKKVGIPLTVNRTAEPGLEDVLTKAMIDAFNKDGRLKVVSNEEADAILYGEVVSFQTVALSFEKGLVTVYRVVMRVDLKLVDLKEKKVIWEEKDMESTLKSDYKPTSDVSATRDTKDEAIRKTCRDISQDIISRIHEGF